MRTLKCSLIFVPIFLLSCVGLVSRDDFLRTEQLSKDVKQFGESLGIEPTEVLTKSHEEGKTVYSYMWIWVQKEGIVSSELVERVYIKVEGLKEDTDSLQLPKAKEALQKYAVGHSLFYRHENQSSSRDSLITPSFVKRKTRRKVEVILHEDLHHSIHAPNRIDESVVTALGHLATLEFFENSEDTKSYEEAKVALERDCRGPSRDLETVVRRARHLFKTVPIEEARKQIRFMVSSYPAYYNYNWPITKDGSPVEAMLSHDLIYLKYCAKIVDLYDLTGGDLKAIVGLMQTTSLETSDEEFEEILSDFAELYIR